jgi:glutathione-regulated potassium-efflux system ancillary protein KefC
MSIITSSCVRLASRPERETFEAALKSGRMTLEALGLGAYEARERADLFRRFNLQMVEEMVAMAENDAASRVAVFKRTSDMLTGIINEDRHHLSLVQRHGWQGRKRAGIPAISPMSRISPPPDANQ